MNCELVQPVQLKRTGPM